MTRWERIDLWYRVEPGFDKAELIDNMRRNGIIVWGGDENTSDKKNVRLGYMVKEGYLNVHGKLASIEDDVQPVGTTSLARKIARDIKRGMTTLPRPAPERKYFEPYAVPTKAGGEPSSAFEAFKRWRTGARGKRYRQTAYVHKPTGKIVSAAEREKMMRK